MICAKERVNHDIGNCVALEEIQLLRSNRVLSGTRPNYSQREVPYQGRDDPRIPKRSKWTISVPGDSLSWMTNEKEQRRA